MNANLFDILARSIADPGKAAIETLSGDRITYADLVARTGRFANALAGPGACGPGDRVAAQVEKSVEAIVLYLATVRAGAVFLPLNTGYTPAEVEYFLGDAEPSGLRLRPRPARESLEPAAAEPPGRTVLTLDADGEGTLTGSGRGASPTPSRPSMRSRRRPRRAALHLRHHRALEGGDAHATATWSRTPRRCARPGASPPTTC